MIFYFSGTGNSRHVARRIGAVLHSPVLAIDELLQKRQLQIELTPDESVGLVFPTYFWGVPAIVCDFLKQLELHCATRPVRSRYFYVVVTYGTSIGGVLRQTRKLLEARGWKLDGRFSVRMVDVWTPLFDLSDTARNMRKTLQAEPVIDRIIEAIRTRSAGGEGPTALPLWLAGLLSYRWYDRWRQTRNFRVLTERCIGCERCVRNCPTHSIALNDQRYPVWEQEQCTLCLRCLHSCPVFAIQYGHRTEKHGQFLYPENIVSGR